MLGFARTLTAGIEMNEVWVRRTMAGLAACSAAVFLACGGEEPRPDPTPQKEKPSENRPPELAVTPRSVTVAAGYPMEPIFISASDPDGDTVSVTVKGAPEGVVLVPQEKPGDPLRLEWTAPADEPPGEFSLEVEASDGEASVTENAIVAVVPNQPPAFDAISDKSIGVDEPLQFTVRATDPEGGEVRISMTTELEGADFDDETGVFRLEANRNAEGTYSVTFVARDPVDAISELSVAVAIVSSGKAPAIEDASPEESVLLVTDLPEDEIEFAVVASGTGTLGYHWEVSVDGWVRELTSTEPRVSLSAILDLVRPDAPLEFGLRAIVSNALGEAERDWTLRFERRAVFVAQGQGAGNGTRWAPMDLLEPAIELAVSERLPHVRIAEGSYELSNPGPIEAAVSLKGGYVAPSWERTGERPQVNVPHTGLFFRDMEGIEISGLRIVAADASGPGASSIALRLVGVVDALVEDNEIVSGRGADGADGAPGGSGASGVRGGDGGDSSSGAGGVAPVAGVCARGGNGGKGGSPGPGDPGEAGTSPHPSVAGGVGGGGGNGGPGSPGNAGAPGLRGPTGAHSSLLGIHLGVDLWEPAWGQDGQPGTPGGGGGGGGGGWGTVVMAVPLYGAGGGAGGSGGCGGEGGKGGQGGGASIGIFVGDTSANVRIARNHIVTGTGGTGGNGGVGGKGGPGGPGGSGGSGTTVDGRGADGRPGGPGGDGGDGGSGAGGPSVGVWDSSKRVLAEENTFELGQAGRGGAVGSNSAPPGLRREIYALMP